MNLYEPIEIDRLVYFFGLTFIALSALISLSVARFVSDRRRKHQIFKLGNVPQASKIPGLFGGNLYNTLSIDNNTEILHNLHLKLGKTFGIFYGPDPWIMTIDLDLLQRVFVTEGSTHIDITQYRLPFVTEINESLAQLRGDKWRKVRRIMAPSFTMHHLKSDHVLDDISDVCDIMSDYIDTHRKLDKKNHKMIVDVHEAFKKFSLEVIFRVAFGRAHKDKFDPNETDQLIVWLNEGSDMLHSNLVLMGIMFDWARYLLALFTPLSPLGSIIRYIHRIIDDSLSKRRIILAQAGSEKNANVLKSKTIDSLIEGFDEGKLSDETLKANLFFILLAGYETSANTLASLFYFLASNEQVQEKLRQSIVGQQDDESQYLDWVIQETLRMFPSVPVAIGRILEHDLEHNGQKFFKGTTVVADIWSIHHWPDYWCNSCCENDLNKFWPERFDEPAPEGVSSARYFAFGIGPRYCIGQNLALCEIRAITRRLISKYRVSICDSSPTILNTKSPNLLHYMITHSIDLEFTEISSL